MPLFIGTWWWQFISNPLRSVTRPAPGAAGEAPRPAANATVMKKPLRILTRSSNPTLTMPDISLSCSKNLGHRAIQHNCNPVLVIRRSLLPATHLGHRAQLAGGIAHHHALSGPFQHIQVVPVIANGPGFLAIHAQPAREPFQRPPF